MLPKNSGEAGSAIVKNETGRENPQQALDVKEGNENHCARVPARNNLSLTHSRSFLFAPFYVICTNKLLIITGLTHIFLCRADTRRCGKVVAEKFSSPRVKFGANETKRGFMVWVAGHVDREGEMC